MAGCQACHRSLSPGERPGPGRWAWWRRPLGIWSTKSISARLGRDPRPRRASRAPVPLKLTVGSRQTASGMDSRTSRPPQPPRVRDPQSEMTVAAAPEGQWAPGKGKPAPSQSADISQSVRAPPTSACLSRVFSPALRRGGLWVSEGLAKLRAEEVGLRKSDCEPGLKLQFPAGDGAPEGGCWRAGCRTPRAR